MPISLNQCDSSCKWLEQERQQKPRHLLQELPGRQQRRRHQHRIAEFRLVADVIRRGGQPQDCQITPGHRFQLNLSLQLFELLKSSPALTQDDIPRIVDAIIRGIPRNLPAALTDGDEFDVAMMSFEDQPAATTSLDQLPG